MKATRYKCELHNERLSQGVCATCERLYWESPQGKEALKDTNPFPIQW